MKYKKSDNLAILTVVGFILAIVLGPKTQTYMTILGILAIAAILLTVFLKLFYFGRDKYVPSRRQPKKEKPFYLDNMPALSETEKASQEEQPSQEQNSENALWH